MEIKTIKLELPVYNRLEEIRGKRETFSQTVERLIFIRDKIANVSDDLAPSLYPATRSVTKDPVGAALNG